MTEIVSGKYFTETDYDLTEEPRNASLMTTGNGYLGVRGSLEEFGSTRIQGFYIRGILDEIVEIVQPFCDNVYIKKYYFDEQELNRFEKQDSCINIADFLFVRFRIGDKVFYPWEGKIVSWRRKLDFSREILSREVVWENEGKKTRFTFERFASYENEHLYCMRATAEPLDHEEPVTILSGIDTEVRTNGQKIVREIGSDLDGEKIVYRVQTGEKYAFRVTLGVQSSFFADGVRCSGAVTVRSEGKIYSECAMPNAQKYTVEKLIGVYTSRDGLDAETELDRVLSCGMGYEQLRAAHLVKWRECFSLFDVSIQGDEKADGGLRFANYHTLISAELHDDVHGLSAKSLSGEKYNMFVWWDCEIYQLKPFIRLMPQVARNVLQYRYRQLPDARKNAQANGYSGAMYPFIASIDGKEYSWKYARHPFLQHHITSDVGYGVLDYYANTLDEDFMERCGAEMLIEICRFWRSRAVKRGNRFEILRVTGTDEHHPYVDNDAYTNYTVKLVVERALSVMKNRYGRVKENLNFSAEEEEDLNEFTAAVYLPSEQGLIPQFDGYFSLSRTLDIEGCGTGTGFQMKQSGLYHKSQVIKQPDVAMLYSFIDFDEPLGGLNANWDYYERMCETSSSLTYPVHAICSAKAGRMLSFLQYFYDTVTVDMADLQHSAWQGVHAGCLAGAWYAIYGGLCGINAQVKRLSFDPVCMPLWKEVKFHFFYQGKKIAVTLSCDSLTLKCDSDLDIYVYGTKYRLNRGKSRSFSVRKLM